MKIDSTKVTANAPAQTVFDFLINTENLYHLMPQDKISDWKADEKSCSFKVQGGITISLVQIETLSPEKIILKSGEKSPFPFTLTVHLTALGDTTAGYIAFDGDVNMFLKMMVEKPLTALFNYMSTKLQEYYAS
jgi:carbon monoxide dehydrogenase subunit G